MILRTFGWSFAVTVVALVLGLVYSGTTGLAVVAILGVLEVSLSFDNAVINASVLQRMSDAWQRVFLTVGVLIAVVGMRLVFPLLVVGVTAHLSPVEAVRLALEKGPAGQPGSYAYLLTQAHPAIAAFGGTFLLLLFLDFVFEDRELTWLVWLERPLARIGRLDQLSVVVALGALALAAETLAAHPATVLLSGVLGIAAYLLVNGLGELFETEVEDEVEGDDEMAAAPEDESDTTPLGVGSGVERAQPAPRPAAAARATGRAALFLFLYIEVLDASFSFDGVIGAFAITSDPILIALGLGVGAMYIRSLTVFLVRQGTLAEYVYLEHGAHWAIGALAVVLLLTIHYDVPEVVTGLLGVAFILGALVSSVVRRRSQAREVDVAEPARQPAVR